MSHKDVYFEYAKTFRHRIAALRHGATSDRAASYLDFVEANTARILDMAKWLAGRKRYREASELLTQTCALVGSLTEEKIYQAWAIKFYIRQLLAMRGKMQKKHWRKATKQRAKYLSQVLDIADNAGLEASVLPKLREWQGLLSDAVEKAETAAEYRIAADLFSRLGGAADLVLIGKNDEAYAHLTKTIVAIAALDSEESTK